jgi:hypothetical protein
MYGFSYAEECSMHFVFHPFPLNYFARYFRWFRTRIIQPQKYQMETMNLIAYETKKSYQEGKADGYLLGLKESQQNDLRLKSVEDLMVRIQNAGR